MVPDFSFDAIVALWNHCPALPEEAKFLLHAHVDHQLMPSLADKAAEQGLPAPAVNDDPMDTKLPGHMRFHEVTDETRTAAWTWRAPMLCPDFPDIAKDVGRLSSSGRRPIVWDRCLSRFTFVTRDEYVRSNADVDIMGFAVHRWLTDVHVDDGIATPIARALTLGGHRVMTTRRGELKLPSAAKGTSFDGVPLLEVRSDQIYFSIRKVALLDSSGRPDGIESRDGEEVVPVLIDRIAEEIKASMKLAEKRGTPWESRVVVLVDRELAWSTLRPLLASAHLAGIQRIDVAVLVDDFLEPLRSVVVHDTTGTAPPLEVSPTTTAQGLVEQAAAGSVPPRLFGTRTLGAP